MGDLLTQATAAMRRTRKRLAYAIQAEADCEAPRRAARLRRQIRAAQRRESEARWTFEALAMGDE